MTNGNLVDWFKEKILGQPPKPPPPLYRPIQRPVPVQAVLVSRGPGGPEVLGVTATPGSLISGSSAHNTSPALDVRSAPRIHAAAMPSGITEAAEGGPSSLVSSHGAQKR